MLFDIAHEDQSGILRDKIMDDRFMYILNGDKQISPSVDKIISLKV